MKLNYTLKDLNQLTAKEGSKIPIFASFLADTETPISLYNKLKKGGEYSFLLESAEQAEKLGRYSFLGFSARKKIVFKDGVATITDKTTKKIKTHEPLKLMKDELEKEQFVPDKNLPRFQGGYVGYISYDCVKYFDQIKLPNKSLFKAPELEFIIPNLVVIHDNQQRRVYLVTYLEFNKEKLEVNLRKVENRLKKAKKLIETSDKQKLLDPPQKKTVAHGKDSKKYQKKVKTALKKIRTGEIFQVVLSEQFISKTKQSSLEIYRKMRDINPSPYMYLLEFDELAVVGSSPETQVRVENNQVLVRPIAGTRHRGMTPKEDKKLAKELLADKKERAEHQMLVDLARNDVGRIAQKGKVTIKNYMTIQKYSHVMHIVSDVYGKLSKEKNIFDAFKACFPAGTLSGAPKIRAMQIISDLETCRRGIYGGAVGYFDFSGNMDFAIAIRTIIKKGNTVCAQAGAGIVFDSLPENEFQECVNKVSSSLSTIS